MLLFCKALAFTFGMFLCQLLGCFLGLDDGQCGSAGADDALFSVQAFTDGAVCRDAAAVGGDAGIGAARIVVLSPCNAAVAQ